jgi:hypothetical protein
MPQITLSRAQIQSLVSFCEAAKSEKFFIAKDHGAYVGYSTGPTPAQQCLFYFKGCDPDKDAEFHDNARRAFGGDDFGEHYPLSHFRQALATPVITKVTIVVTRRSVRFQAYA